MELVALPRKPFHSKCLKNALTIWHYVVQCTRSIWYYVVLVFLQFFMLAVGILLLVMIISPVFLHFDADGAVRFCDPRNKGTDVSEESSVKMTVDWLKDQKYSVELSGGTVKLNLADTPKHTVEISGSGTRHSFLLKFVNVAMAIAAYIFGLIFLSLLLRGLLKAERKHRLLGEYGGLFRKLLAASPECAKHQEAFLNEMMSLYFDKKEE